MTLPVSVARSRRSNYDRVAPNDDNEEIESAGVASPSISSLDADDTSPLAASSVASAADALDDIDDDGEERITIVILDPAQSKFQIAVSPEWTIAKVKEIGAAVHKVTAGAQRLIYRGRLLEDDTTLKDSGIAADKTIIHLFPKPKVVLEGDESDDAQGERGGAHIPQIVLARDEAEMRSSILVLGSAEIMEAQNNVKLLSFLLLIVCSMELLALFSIMLNPDSGSSSDSSDGGSSADEMNQPEMRHWRTSDYFDLALSSFGLYVATLGIKATTENTRSLARRYMICTVIVGICWNAFYFYLNVVLEKEAAAKREEKYHDEDFMPENELYEDAFLAILIPMMVWILCCIRAWQFHRLIAEAENEAEQRIRSELDLEVAEGSGP